MYVEGCVCAEAKSCRLELIKLSCPDGLVSCFVFRVSCFFFPSFFVFAFSLACIHFQTLLLSCLLQSIFKHMILDSMYNVGLSVRRFTHEPRADWGSRLALAIACSFYRVASALALDLASDCILYWAYLYPGIATMDRLDIVRQLARILRYDQIRLSPPVR